MIYERGGLIAGLISRKGVKTSEGGFKVVTINVSTMQTMIERELTIKSYGQGRTESRLDGSVIRCMRWHLENGNGWIHDFMTARG